MNRTDFKNTEIIPIQCTSNGMNAIRIAKKRGILWDRIECSHDLVQLDFLCLVQYHDFSLVLGFVIRSKLCGLLVAMAFIVPKTILHPSDLNAPVFSVSTEFVLSCQVVMHCFFPRLEGETRNSPWHPGRRARGSGLAPIHG